MPNLWDSIRERGHSRKTIYIKMGVKVSLHYCECNLSGCQEVDSELPSLFYPDDGIGGRRRSLSLMEIELLTGRHHQIRAQMSNAGNASAWGQQIWF